MSSASDYEYKAADSSPSSSDQEAHPRASPPSRRQSRTPMTPRKRRRLDSIDPSRARNYYFEGRYNDAYRELYNAHVHSAATRIEPHDGVHPYTSQIGASTWSSDEKARLFAALERYGKDDAPSIARAVATKSIPETRQLLLLLHDAAAKQGDVHVTLRDVPAAIEVGAQCDGQLDMLAEALAWYQEMHEASQEQAKYGEYWLITNDLASQVEIALASEGSRAGSSVPPSGGEGRRRGGRVVPGACVSCKLHKQKCDRAIPCGTCVRRKLEPCVYPAPAANQSAKPKPSIANTPEAPLEKSAEDIVQAIPEAHLLNPETMLTLSRNVFMNRSPSIPSPWPHWSEIVSDHTEEPALYRSAFNDFHTLAVSLTKRLMQTAIIQATSRLRSQRRRTKKGAVPLVKRRDILTALDIVGMKRDGQQRWQGVARRCALRVFQAVARPGIGRKSKEEIPWPEVERIMAPEAIFAEPLTTDTEASDDSSSFFKRRAARSGTPLPLDQLTLTDSQDESDMEDRNDDFDVSMHDDASGRQTTQPRDFFGRYTSVPPTGDQQVYDADHQTIEQFDQAASREEQRALWETLNLQAPTKDNKDLEDADNSDLELTEKIVTDADEWRSWIDYRPEWEEFDCPVSHTQFTANMKLLPSIPPMVGNMQHNPNTSSPDDHSSSHEGIPPRKRKPVQSVELQTQNPRAYAAHQERVARSADEDDDESDESLTDRPTQSIEIANGLPHTQRDESMDWDAFMDL